MAGKKVPWVFARNFVGSRISNVNSSFIIPSSRMGTLCRMGAGRCGLIPDKALQKCALRAYRRKEDNNGRSTASFALG
jgi:hypothetical protein